MAKAAGAPGDQGRQERSLTVARAREQADHAEVTFYESARFYRLPRANPGYAAAVATLRAAAANGRPLRVRFAAPNSDIIAAVRIED